MNSKMILENWKNEIFLRDLVSKMAADGKMKFHIQPVVDYVKTEVTWYSSGFDDINDQDDADYFTAVKYVELKARWIQMNLRLSYQAFTAGEGDPFLLLRAGATSHLLATIEPSVNKVFLTEIQKLLAQPVFGEDVKNAA